MLTSLLKFIIDREQLRILVWFGYEKLLILSVALYSLVKCWEIKFWLHVCNQNSQIFFQECRWSSASQIVWRLKWKNPGIIKLPMRPQLFETYKKSERSKQLNKKFEIRDYYVVLHFSRHPEFSEKRLWKFCKMDDQ